MGENVRKRNAATFLPLGSFSAGVTLSGTQKTMSQTSPRERTDAKASGVETAGVEKEHEINCSRDGETTSQRERNDDAERRRSHPHLRELAHPDLDQALV